MSPFSLKGTLDKLSGGSDDKSKEGQIVAALRMICIPDIIQNRA